MCSPSYGEEGLVFDDVRRVDPSVTDEWLSVVIVVATGVLLAASLDQARPHLVASPRAFFLWLPQEVQL